MAYVHILSEDDFDDQVYVYILEMLLGGASIERNHVRLRRGGGIGEVRKKVPILLSHIRRTGLVDDTYFVVALDNDRKPEHAKHEGAARPPPGCRHCDLENAIHAAMPDGWPIPGAVAVPVQMIESWLLLMHDPVRYAEATLPQCGLRDQPVAREMYGANPPPQLKDLLEIEQRASRSSSKEDFALACILRLDPADLAERSASFAHFRRQVSTWLAPAPGGGG
jgi:hypothetical protein